MGTKKANKKKRPSEVVASDLQELDQIFKSTKKSKTDDREKSLDKRATPIKGNKDDLFGREVQKGRMKTKEGFVIYSEDELRLNIRDSGGTERCPFDCDCCF